MSSFRKLDQAFQVLIGKTTVVTSGTTQISDVSLGTFPASGQIVITNGLGTVVTSAATLLNTPQIQIHQSRGATSDQPLVSSKVINAEDIISITAKPYVADTEQITYVGYDGSAGSFDTTAGTDFVFRLTGRWNNGVYNTHKLQVIKQYSATTVTQQNLARFITEDINSDIMSYCKAEMLSDGTFTQLTNAAAVTNGSKTVTSTAHGLVAGDKVRIGSSASTSPVYIVAAVPSSSVITLNTPYQGVSNAALANTAIGKMTAQTNFGVKLTGLPLKWSLGFFDYEKVAFDVSLNSAFGATTTNRSVEAYKGNGTGKIIAELERQSTSLDGVRNFSTQPVDAGRTDADSTANYSTIDICYVDRSDDKHIISGTKPSRGHVIIACVSGATQWDAATYGVSTVLNAYGTAIGIPITTVTGL